ncbi:hypothetical protein OFO07_07280 [Campylobacter sp. JMF_06 NA1]|uniref:MBOAT family O-acyltransferase n=1 Tax=Campylobacter sp. JMF_06 NA1 TaxID=2983823 RepID=UPI0022E9E229|nr:MBOAT family O-acyltransferase [Campylobacter sp. JMF_06 NA1]MDA3078716.1 hypothetical protein [Campylobacter sp. JMF_06 NA1]
MTFFSPEFILLFTVFFALYWSQKDSVFIQKILILAASYGFVCSVSPKFGAILFAYSCFVYFAGKFLRRNSSNSAILSAVFGSICFLCFFKYFSHIREFFAIVTNFFGLSPIESIALPLGISYYTFMSITYLVAVGKKQCEGADFLSLLCYLAFFPSVVMGPIGRAAAHKNSKGYTKIYPVLPQFNQKKSFKNGDKILALFIIGAFKVLVICGHLTPFVGEIFSNIYDFSEVSALKIVLAILLYSFVIYTNFSGFIDIARALALALGFALPRNFHMPYTARNIDQFWDRWHISLSTFIRDYIYIPLGGNCGWGKKLPVKLKIGAKKKKKKKAKKEIIEFVEVRGAWKFWRMNFNIMLAFLLSGIWHGVGLNFAIWGALHGLACVWLKCLRACKVKPLNLHFSRLITFIYVSFAWVFFANTDFSEIGAIFSALISSPLYQSKFEILLVLAVLIFVLIYPKFLVTNRLIEGFLKRLPFWLKGVVLGVVFCAIYLLMPSGIPNFIYASF